MPAVIATAASTVIHAVLAYSSQKPRRVRLSRSSAVLICSLILSAVPILPGRRGKYCTGGSVTVTMPSRPMPGSSAKTWVAPITTALLVCARTVSPS
ncbi:MAG: hypothetical protein WB608_07380 [Terracidiphilus sp.]